MKQLRVLNNPKSIEFESQMHGKIAILIAAMLVRHQGGDSIDDWVTYASKEEADISSLDHFDSAFA